MAARNDAHGAAVARQGIQVKGHLVIADRPRPAPIGVPVGIANVVVAVAAQVVEVIAQQTGQDAIDAAVVQQAGQIFALIDEGHDAGARRAVVAAAVVTASALLPHRFEGGDDLVGAIAHQPRKVQVSEGFHERQLLRGEL